MSDLKRQAGYIVGSVVENECTDKNYRIRIAKNPVTHGSQKLAFTEAERLAKAFHEKQFVVLEIVGTVKVSVNPVIWG